MTEEEKKAIAKIKRTLYMFPESAELRTLLNLIQKQDTEINKLNNELKYYKKLYFETNDWIKYGGDHVPRIN